MRYLSLPLAVAALAVAAIIALAAPWTSGAQAQTPSAPQISGTITIANPAQPENVYLNPGDAIYLKAYTTRDLRPIVITPQISEANHFHFRYHNDSAKSASYAAHRANLAAIGEDATGQYLLYKHIVQKGALSNSVKRLYFASSPAPAASADLCAPADDGSCAGFSFNAPANNSALGGTVKVAGGGSPADYGISSYTTPTAKAIEVVPVNPPDTGWYNVGDDITVRLTYNARVHPISPDLAARFNESRITLNIGPNNATNLKEAVLVQAGNIHDGGYADFRYTVAEGDADSDGFQVFNVVTRPTTRETIVCPEFIGPGCASANTVNLSFSGGGTQAVASYKVAGTALGWAKDGKKALIFSKSHDNPPQQAGTITGAITGQPVHYSIDRNLPAGLSMAIGENGPSISGNPSSMQAAQYYVITARDLTGQQASRTISIAVDTEPGPKFSSDQISKYTPIIFRHQLPAINWVITPSLSPATSGATPITYQLTQADGSALPSWLVYTQTTSTQPGSLSTIANPTFTGRISLKQIATDANSKTAENEFTIEINDPRPIFFGDSVSHDLELTPGNLTGNVTLPPALGGSKSYTYQLQAESNGSYSASAVPSWIRYTGTASSPGTVSVTSGATLGSVNLRLEATDSFYRNKANLDFTVSIANPATVSLDTTGRTATTSGIYIYRPGDVIKINARTSATSSGYTGRTPQPTMTLSIGGQTRTAAYDAGASAPATGRHVFAYTVTAADRWSGDDCAVIAINNAELRGSGTLTGCRIDPGAPSFANAAAVNLIAPTAQGGYGELPRADKGFGAIAYDVIPNSSPAAIKGVAYDGSNGRHGVSVAKAADVTGRTLDTAISYRLTAIDQLGRRANFDFTIEATEVAQVQYVEIWNSRHSITNDYTTRLGGGSPSGETPSGDRFFNAGDQILILVSYQEGQKGIAAAGDETSPAAYIELNVGGKIRRAEAVSRTTPDRTIVFQYVVQPGDHDPDGVTVSAGVIHNCQRITGYSGATLNQHKMTETIGQCAIPASVYVDPHDRNTTVGIPVRTARQPGDYDLDADDDGLIDINTPGQLIAMILDANGADGNGVPDNPAAAIAGVYHANLYYETIENPSGFPSTSKSPDRSTGCPGNVCRGYELVNDITMPAITALGLELRELVSHGLGSYNNQWNSLLEGNGFRILGLAIDTTESEAGLFRYIGPNGIVRNLGFVNPSVKGDQFVGIIAGTNAGTISNVYVQNGQVTAISSSAGLIAGQLLASGAISNFWATGAVNTPGADGAGSVVGTNYGAIRNGWTDAFTDTALPIRRAQGYNVVAGYGSSNVSPTAKEIHAGTAWADDNFKAFLITQENLAKATAATPGNLANWSDRIWDFGDACQRPVLKSGGHHPVNQLAAQGPACTQ